MKRVISILLCLVLLSTCAYASGLTNVEINQTIQSGDDLYVIFHAEDEYGEALSGLTTENVHLEVGGQVLDDELKTADALGMGYVFAVDISASLTVDQFAAVQEQMKAIVNSLGEQDQVAIVSFGTSVTTVSDFTNNKNTLKAVIDGLSPVDQYTMLYSGVMRAVDLATRQGDGLPLRRAVIVLSDGLNTVDDGTSMTEMRDKAVSAGIPLYIAGIKGDGNGESLAALGEMARAAGGAIYTGTKDELAQCFEKLNAYISSGVLAAAKIPPVLADGSLKGLILTASVGDISAMDSMDIRFTSLPMTAEPSPTPVPSPTPTAEAAGSASSEPEPASDEPTVPPEKTERSLSGKGFFERNNMYIYAGCIALLLVIFAVFLAMYLKKRKHVPAAERQRQLPEDRPADDSDTTDINDSTVTINRDGYSGGDILVLTDSINGRAYTSPMKDRITIGRRDTNDIVIADGRVSGSHCEIIRDKGQVYVRDMGSTNGTNVIAGGIRYKVDGISGQEIQVGDEIEIGYTRLEITEL